MIGLLVLLAPSGASDWESGVLEDGQLQAEGAATANNRT